MKKTLTYLTLLTSLFLYPYTVIGKQIIKADRNSYMLGEGDQACTNCYDWWWHSFTGVSKKTGEEQAFFIEYYVINPGLGEDAPVLGQLEENKKKGKKPSYAMIKAGTWKKDGSKQINNFYAINQFSGSSKIMDVRIGDNIATDTKLVGGVKLSPKEASDHPEYMSEAGEMKWDLKVNKVLYYSAGYPTSKPFRSLKAFEMFWHVHGMKTKYSGTVELDGEVFDVVPEKSYGYQDKNWGRDYTNPWIWLNCNNFVNAKTKEKLPFTSLVVGGGVPKVFGISLGSRLLIAFYYRAKLYELNFSKFWNKTDVNYKVSKNSKRIKWFIEGKTKDLRIEISFTAPISHMLKINYENPKGMWNHKNLWNTGVAEGSVSLWEREGSSWIKVGTFNGTHGGAEYGHYKEKIKK